MTQRPDNHAGSFGSFTQVYTQETKVQLIHFHCTFVCVAQQTLAVKSLDTSSPSVFYFKTKPKENMYGIM